MSRVAAQGIAVAGPVFSHHLAITATGWDFEVRVPVKARVTAEGRVRPGRLEATRIAWTSYRGPYEGLGKAWSEFRVWIAEARRRSGPLRGLPGRATGDEHARHRTRSNASDLK